MITFLIPFALIGTTQKETYDREVDNLKGQKVVSILVENVSDDGSVPSRDDLRNAIELELRSKGIPIANGKQFWATLSTDDAGKLVPKPSLETELYLRVDSMSLETISSSGYCYNVVMEAQVSNYLPHNPLTMANTILWHKGYLLLSARKAPATVEAQVLSMVKDFELKWLKAHAFKSVDKKHINTALTPRPVI